MKYFIAKHWKTYFFFFATVGVAFLISQSFIKPRPPRADIAEADLGEVAGAAISQNFASQIPEKLMPSPRVFAGSFLTKSPEELLTSLSVIYDEKAIIQEIGLPSKYGLGYNQVIVLDPQKVFYQIGETEGAATTWQKTVGELIDELKLEKGIEVGEADIVEPSRETEITRSDIFVLKVTSVEKTVVIEKESLAFKTITETDPNLIKGKKVVKQKGQKGVKEYVYDVERHLIDGKWQIKKKLLVKSEITKEPLAEILSLGSKEEVYGTGKATFYDAPLSDIAAHRTLPLGTVVEVVNLKNGKSVKVRIGDRGPFGEGRVIDLSRQAFSQIGSLGEGIVPVKIVAVGE